MAGTAKFEFPPLLPVGMHEMLLPEIRQRCVDAFPLSTTRGTLMSSLETICVALSTALIASEVWVNGSFLTQKIDPADVDLAVRLSHERLPSPSPQQGALLNRVAAKQFTGCDSFVFVEYPINHPQHATGDMMRAYWQRQFGFSRADSFKGVAVVRTPFS